MLWLTMCVPQQRAHTDAMAGEQQLVALAPGAGPTRGPGHTTDLNKGPPSSRHLGWTGESPASPPAHTTKLDQEAALGQLERRPRCTTIIGGNQWRRPSGTADADHHQQRPRPASNDNGHRWEPRPPATGPHQQEAPAGATTEQGKRAPRLHQDPRAQQGTPYGGLLRRPAGRSSQTCLHGLAIGKTISVNNS